MASSSMSPRWNYDVFLSFRGEDTREGFTNFLYDALCRHGINTFLDDQLPKGEGISAELSEKIEESRISIVVFSENYTSSGWCLDELVKILECKETKGHMVRPIFYRVDPSELRKQTGKTGDYLAKHEDKFGKDSERVMKWRKSLEDLANMAGWHGTCRVESKLIQTIVEEVSSKLNRPALNVATHPVGIDDTLDGINPILGIGLDDVRMIGFYGIGGIGKSTVAKAIYNLHADDFKGSSFLANVKEVSRQHGLVQVQETLLFELLGDSNIKLGNADRGISLISSRLCYKKVLIVIDDIDHLYQLRKLAGDKSWFGSGSRIIITTRDKHLLEAHGVEHFHEVKKLNCIDSYKLFCWNAFKSPNPPKEFEDLTCRLLDYAKGLPLALIVLGSFLCGRNVREWESAIARLQSVPNREYNEILKISYDGLDDLEKAIFLDIACFFNGDDRDYVTKVFDACKFFPDIGIRVLLDKSLISIELNKLSMHDLLQEMGREIVRKESPNNPGERSRLWYSEDITDVLTENLGTNKVEAIKIVLPETEEVYLNAKAFKRMRRLRVLIIHNAYVSGDFDHLSNNLRWVDWEGYPLPSLPANFHPKKLVGLFMPNSHIKDLGQGYKIFKNLKHMSFEGSGFLTEIPDFSALPNLESLILTHCTSLLEVHDSVGLLDRLVTLNLEHCYNLRKLPTNLKLKSLQTLLLTRCRRLETFPNNLENMESLKELRLSKIAIKELPSSIGNLVGLEVLCISGCKKLKGLPSGIHKLLHLKHLLLRNCFELGKFLDNTEDKWQAPETSDRINVSTSCMESGEHLVSVLRETKSFPFGTSLDGKSLPEFPFLQSLDLRNCNLTEVNFLMNMSCISTLEELEFSWNNFVKLPAWISELADLRKLELNFCRQLQEVPILPPSIGSVSAIDCESLEVFSQLSNMVNSHTKDFPHVKSINLTNCQRLAENLGDTVANILLNQDPTFSLTLPGCEIPEWFKYQTKNGFFYFQVPELLCAELVGFALCAVVSESFTCELQGTINGELVIKGVENFISLKSDHLWLLYFPCPVVKAWEGCNYIEFSLEEIDAVDSSIEKFITRCGLFLEFKHEEKLNWTLENNIISATHYPEVIYDEDSEESMGSADEHTEETDAGGEYEDDSEDQQRG
ncbi:disease resistance protein RPV1-like [Syzygium oleosum]|uniref:disease resistance protein RPV1-like n=1 Tax=Syzygium oleosum TaxID=219896 RepID=UPI0024BB8B71|nr:disease resistance protein RPV1-like [Syzygium oleosum]